MTGPWVARPTRLRFSVGEVVLGAVTFSSLVLDGHFTRWVGEGPEPELPFDRFPEGVELARAQSYPVRESLPRLAFRPGWIRYVPAQYRRHLVDLSGGSFENYLGKFSAKTRSTLRRKVRRFEASAGEPCWREFRRPGEMAEFHDLARLISRKTYQERLLGSGLPDGEDFRQELARLASEDRVRCYLLQFGGRPIAFLHCREEGGSLLYLHVGHDPEFSDWSPGTVLIYRALERLFAEGRFTTLDFTEGEGTHKEFFSTRSVPCADLLYFRKTPGHLLLLGLHSGLGGCSRAAAGLLGATGLKSRIKRLVRSRARGS